MEHLLFKYKDIIINNLRVENNFLASKHQYVKSILGYVYILKSACTKSGLDKLCYKYGKGTDIKKIIKKYQTGNPKAELICYVPLESLNLSMDTTEDCIDMITIENAVKKNHETAFFDNIDKVKEKILDCIKLLKSNSTKGNIIEFKVSFIYIISNTVEIYHIKELKSNYNKCKIVKKINLNNKKITKKNNLKGGGNIITDSYYNKYIKYINKYYKLLYNGNVDIYLFTNIYMII